MQIIITFFQNLVYIVGSFTQNTNVPQCQKRPSFTLLQIVLSSRPATRPHESGWWLLPTNLKIVNFLFTVSPSGINCDSLILRHSEQDASATQSTLSLSLKKGLLYKKIKKMAISKRKKKPAGGGKGKRSGHRWKV